MTQRLFVYGTLAPGRPNEHVLSAISGSWQSASVRGKLHQEGWGADLGYPGIVLDESAQEVAGFLFSSDNLLNHWARLDAFEGKGYERVSTIAELDDGSKVETFIYVLRR